MELYSYAPIGSWRVTEQLCLYSTDLNTPNTQRVPASSTASVPNTIRSDECTAIRLNMRTDMLVGCHKGHLLLPPDLNQTREASMHLIKANIKFPGSPFSSYRVLTHTQTDRRRTQTTRARERSTVSHFILGLLMSPLHEDVWRTADKTPRIPSAALHGGELVVRFTPWPHYVCGESRRYPLDRRMSDRGFVSTARPRTRRCPAGVTLLRVLQSVKHEHTGCKPQPRWRPAPRCPLACTMTDTADHFYRQTSFFAS